MSTFLHKGSLLALALALFAASVDAAPRRRAKARPARASSARVVVLPVGGKATPAFKAVAKGLSASGVKLVTVRELSALEGMPESRSDYVAAARQLNATAFVLVDSGKGRVKVITATVFNGRDGKALGVVKWKAPPPRGARSLQKTAFKRLRPLLARGQAPAADEAPRPAAAEPLSQVPPEPAPDEKEKEKEQKKDEAERPSRTALAEAQGSEDEDAEEDEDAPRGDGGLLFDGELGVRGFSRRLNFTDDVFNAVSGYRVRMAPALELGLEYYPGVHLGSSRPLSYLGVTFAGDYTLGLSSVTDDGSQLSTRAYGFSGGLKGRYPVGASEVGFGLSFGSRVFNVAAPASGMLPLPDAGYQYVRGLASGRIALSPTLALRLGAGYLHVLDAGELSTGYFPNLSGGGVEGSLSIAYRLTDALELRVGGTGQRFFFSMNPQVGDTYVAGGAVDQYLAATLGLGLRLE